MNAQDRDALRILRELLDLDADARETGLAARCGNDAALADRVRALLARTDAADPEPAADNVAGRRIGPYRLLRRLGRGGMGEVFLAERADGQWQRQVALKRIRGGIGLLDDRFRRERQVLARLQHPNIAPLLDGGVTPEGQPWFAMEYVRGEPIADWCDARDLPVEARVDLVRQVCDAVRFAHANLVVHRDIKPANIVVGDDGRARLLDFGIAKLLDEVDPTQTQTHAMTPAWAAPEQRRGDPVSIATDVYQLGLLLRALLADAAGMPQASISSAFAQRMRTEPDTAARIAQARGSTPSQLLARLRGDLDAIVARATADDPRERYAGADALAEDLQRWLDGAPVQARRAERGYRARRFARRWWPAMAAAAGVIVLVAYHVTTLRTQIDIVRAERDRTEDVAEQFTLLFKLARPREAEAGEVSARELLDRSVAKLRADTTMDPATRGALLAATSRAQVQLSLSREAVDTGRLAIAVLRSSDAPDPEQLARIHYRIAGPLHHLSRNDEASAEIDRGLALIEGIDLREQELRFDLRRMAANLAAERGDEARARRELTAVEAETIDAVGPDERGKRVCFAYIGAANVLATMDIDELDPASGERRLRALLDVVGRCRIEDRLYVLAPTRFLVAALLDQGKLDEADAVMRRNLAESREHLAPDDGFLAGATSTAGLVELMHGRWDAGRRLFAEAERIDGSRRPVDDPMRIRYRAFIALCDLLETTADGALDGGMRPRLRDAVTRLDEAVRAFPTTASRDRINIGFFRLAASYGRCRLTPDVATRAAFEADFRAAERLRGYQRTLIRDWAPACRGDRSGPSLTS